MSSTVTAEPLQLSPTRPAWYNGLARAAVRNPLGTFGAVVVAALIVVAAFAPAVATHSAYALHAANRFASPDRQHLFGTDNLGRDIFSRVVYGARISLEVGIVSVVVGTVIGTAVGLVSAYCGGTVDFWLQRMVDALFAFPVIVLALAIVAALGPGLINVIIAVAITSIPRMGRVVRSSALTVMTQPYIEAAKSTGDSSLRIILWHLLPNCLAPIIVLVTANFGGAILAEASLSFLGLGIPPPSPSWGAMLSGAAQQYVRLAPWMAIFPGVAITLVVLGFNLLGDALRDVLDPRLRA